MPSKEVSSILADTKDSYSNNSPYELFLTTSNGYTCGFDPYITFSRPLLKPHVVCVEKNPLHDHNTVVLYNNKIVTFLPNHEI